MSSNLAKVEQIEDLLMDITQKAQENNNQIEISKNSLINKLIIELSDLLKKNQISSNNEKESQEQTLTLLKLFLQGINTAYVYEYGSSQIEKFSTQGLFISLIIFLLAEKLFSMFLLFLLSHEKTSEVYKEGSIF